MKRRHRYHRRSFDHPEWSDRGYLPHYDEPGLIQHVTIHLADSLPTEARIELQGSLEQPPFSPEEKRRRLHQLLDAGYGSCVLARPVAAALVEESLLHFEGVRYQLHAWTVLPNHVHVLLHTKDGFPLKRIVGTWKRFTAGRLRNLCRRGALPGTSLALLTPVWHREYYDRCIRDDDHYRSVVNYIDANPVKAGLVATAAEWRWCGLHRPGLATFLDAANEGRGSGGR